MNSVTEFRAGGTDLQARLRLGVKPQTIQDIYNRDDLKQIIWNKNGSVTIGALVTIDTLATDPQIKDAYPALSKAAAGLATPQIRRMGTLGGNLLQRTRCPYYRHPTIACHKKGGNTCPSRSGYHEHGIIFDTSECVFPHPSTLALAVMVYEGTFEGEGASPQPITELYGDGSDSTRDHLLPDNTLLTYIHLPPPSSREMTAYFRAISRAEAEWPLVEVVVRLSVNTQQIIESAKIAIGGVAVIPLRLPNVEQALVGQPATMPTFAAAASLAGEGATPLPQTSYKVKLLRETILETLERAV